jgi:hypothetical protein
MKRLVLLALAAVLICIGFWAKWSPRPIEAALVLADLRAGAAPSLFKRLTPRPERQKLTATVGDRRLTGDLYLPGDKAGAGLVLVPGAARDGKDDPRLVALAQTLARARFVVLVPDMASPQPAQDAARFLAEERHMPQVIPAAPSLGADPLPDDLADMTALWRAITHLLEERDGTHRP